MISIVFKNLEKSDLARSIVEERVLAIIERFPDLKLHKIRVTLEMENSPTAPGPDSFSVTIALRGPKYNDVQLTRKHTGLYSAVQEVAEGILDLLNRAGDRTRVKSRQSARLLPRTDCA